MFLRAIDVCGEGLMVTSKSDRENARWRERNEMLRLTFFLCAVLFSSGAATLSNATEPTPTFAPKPDNVVVYQGCTLIDGSGAPVRREMAIVTRGERIESIMPAAELRVPSGAEVVDVKGRFALPGLVNSHEHLATPPDRKFAEAMMRRDLYGGVTAVRGMGDDARALADLAVPQWSEKSQGPIFIMLHFSRGQIFSTMRA